MAQLSFTDKFAWYGLREQPTYEELLRTVKKPVRLPIPSRAEKWYATGIYRSFLLDAANKYNDHEQKNMEYDRGGGHLPRPAANDEESAAGNDRAWQEHDRFNHALDHEEAYRLAASAVEAEHRSSANSIRRQQLSTYGPALVHPTLEAHHRDLQYQNVPHPAPVPRLSMPRMSWPTVPDEFAAAGQPQAPEFPTFEALNLGQDRKFKHGRVDIGANQSYQQLRENYTG